MATITVTTDETTLNIEVPGIVTGISVNGTGVFGEVLRGRLRNVVEMILKTFLEEQNGPSEVVLNWDIRKLGISERPYNALRRAKINTVGELVKKTEDDLLNLADFGPKALEEVTSGLDALGLSLHS